MEKLSVSVKKSLDNYVVWALLQKLMVLMGIIFLIIFNFTKERSVIEQFKWLNEFSQLQTATRLSAHNGEQSIKFNNGLEAKVSWITISDDYELQMALQFNSKALKVISKEVKRAGYSSFQISNKLEPLDTIVTFDAETVKTIKQTYIPNNAGYYEVFTTSEIDKQFWGYNRMLCRPLVWLKLKTLYCFKLALPAWLLIVIVSAIELVLFVLLSHLLKYLLCLAVMFMAQIIFPAKFRT